jgi:hypothetical protein
MTGVPRELIKHELHLDPKAKPVKQRLYHFAQDKKDVIKRKIGRLLDAGFIKEVYHPDWLANPVLVTKKNKDWRMCVDYTDLNKACKKDHFGSPQRRSNQDILHHSIWRILLYNNAIWTQKNRCNISKGYTMVSAFPATAQR